MRPLEEDSVTMDPSKSVLLPDCQQSLVLAVGMRTVVVAVELEVERVAVVLLIMLGVGAHFGVVNFRRCSSDPSSFFSPLQTPFRFYSESADNRGGPVV